MQPEVEPGLKFEVEVLRSGIPRLTVSNWPWLIIPSAMRVLRTGIVQYAKRWSSFTTAVAPGCIPQNDSRAFRSKEDPSKAMFLFRIQVKSIPEGWPSSSALL